MSALSLEGSADPIPALSLPCLSANSHFPFKTDGALLWGLLKMLETIKQLCELFPNRALAPDHGSRRIEGAGQPWQHRTEGGMLEQGSWISMSCWAAEELSSSSRSTWA